MKRTLVLGASESPQRYSYLAVKSLVKHNHPVMAIGKRPGKIGNISIETGKKLYENIDTITLYLNPANQKKYYEYILSLQPKRLIFNPGAENAELFDLAKDKGIAAMEACTLVLLSTGQY